MHEVGIAESILDIVRQYVPDEQAPLVRAVHVRVGTLTAVLPESLEFCFQAIVAGTRLADARLCIERPPTAELAVRELELADEVTS
jgi:hydrogenase nickel incorporation protein HypA/HybF